MTLLLFHSLPFFLPSVYLLLQYGFNASSLRRLSMFRHRTLQCYIFFSWYAARSTFLLPQKKECFGEIVGILMKKMRKSGFFPLSYHQLHYYIFTLPWLPTCNLMIISLSYVERKNLGGIMYKTPFYISWFVSKLPFHALHSRLFARKIMRVQFILTVLALAEMMIPSYHKNEHLVGWSW